MGESSSFLRNGVLWAGRCGDLLRRADALVQGQARSLQGLRVSDWEELTASCYY